MTINTSLPSSNPALRKAIYDGCLFLVDSTTTSIALVEAVKAHVQAAFGWNFRNECLGLANDEFMARFTETRIAVREDKTIRRLIKTLMTEVGFPANENAIDVPRLRAVLPGGHKIEAAAPVYYAHRDTWYANPASQINWWLPLHEVDSENSFAFDEEVFNIELPNDSAAFDYNEWKAKVGFQNPSPPKEAVYPKTTYFESDKATHVICKEAQILLFSACQLHKTTENETSLARFSLDIRSVNLSDFKAGDGGPNDDNLSKGSTLTDYHHPKDECDTIPS